MKKLFLNQKKKKKKLATITLDIMELWRLECLGGNIREDQAQELGLLVTF